METETVPIDELTEEHYYPIILISKKDCRACLEDLEPILPQGDLCSMCLDMYEFAPCQHVDGNECPLEDSIIILDVGII